MKDKQKEDIGIEMTIKELKEFIEEMPEGTVVSIKIDEGLTENG